MTEHPSRLEQLGELLTAAIAVMIAGDSGLTKRRSRRPRSRPLLPEIDRRHFRQGGRYCGALSKVAKDLGIKPATAHQVFSGFTVSDRVASAIRREIRRLDRVTRPEDWSLTEEEKALLKLGGAYRGVAARAAARLHTSHQHISRCVAGKYRSRRVVAALRKEIARVDAEIAAKKGGQQ